MITNNIKKLLTTITLSTLVGSSVSNLKPVFTNSIVSHGVKSEQLNKEIINRSENDNPFISKVNNLAGATFNSPNGDIYLGNLDGLYKSIDNGINFKKISDLRQINNLAFSSSGIFYIASDNGLYKSTDGTTFTKISDLTFNNCKTMLIKPNGDIYVWSYGLWK